MLKQHLSPAAAKERAEFIRIIEFDNETRLHGARDALQGLRDLCLECPGDITKIGNIGNILDLICRELDAVQIGVPVEEMP